MRDVGLQSIYALYLEGEIPRSNLYRWLRGEATIPTAGAHSMISVLESRAARDETLAALRDLLRRGRDKVDAEARILTEFRVRRVPLRRAMEALRAACILEGDINAK